MSRPTDDAIYLNNAGTSFPKPDTVISAVSKGLRTLPGSAPEVYEECLDRVSGALGVDKQRLLFTSSCTQALDIALSSLPWAAGDVVVTSHLEHNGVVGPLTRLGKSVGVEHVRAAYVEGAPFDLAYLEQMLQGGKVKLVAVCTASNVTGEILPIQEIADLAHAHGALLLADAAQTFGLLEEDATSLGCDLLTFAGHKNPLGPQGIGGLWASEKVSFDLEALSCDISDKESCEAERAMPGYCDVGGLNVAALAGLCAGLEAYAEERPERMRAARSLASEFARLVRQINGATVFGHSGGPQTATVSFVHERLTLSRAESYFASRNLVVRAGTHCAHDALQAIGAPQGTVRVSFGPANTAQDMKAAAVAVLEL